MITWDIYEIHSEAESLHGVKLRGRIRKYSIDNDIACLVENAADVTNTVRFAVLSDCKIEELAEFITSVAPSAIITESLREVPNPVLSKLTINDLDRYIV